MESQGDLPYYIGIINRDIDIDSSLLGISQNNPMSFFDSPPQVSMTLLRKQNEVVLMPYTVMSKYKIHFVKKFGNTSRSTILLVPHVLLFP